MSGPRPVHLKRRGAVYAVRFRLPQDLAKRLEVTELQRSLQTKEVVEARQQCLAATIWFRQVIEQLRQDPAATRRDLERMARAYFDHRVERNHVRSVRGDHFADADLAEQLELTQARLAELDEQLRRNDFDRSTEVLAENFLGRLSSSIQEVRTSTRALAAGLAARAERQQLRYLQHQLTSPGQEFLSDDALFSRGMTPPLDLRPQWSPATRQQEDFNLGAEHADPTLGEVSAQFLARKKAKGRGASQVTELARAAGWLMEVLGRDTPMSCIRRKQLRSFRDDLERLDVTLRGQTVPFKARLTNEVGDRIKTVTAQRYWLGISQMFAWAQEEFDLADNPAAGLRMESNSQQFRQSPAAYSREELESHRPFIQRGRF